MRATLAAPSRDGSTTRTLRWRPASSSVSAREARTADLLVRDEEQRRISRPLLRELRHDVHGDGDARLHVEDARPRSPVAFDPVRELVERSRAQTVSRCPRIRTPPAPFPARGDQGVAASRARTGLGRDTPFAQAIADPEGQ